MSQPENPATGPCVPVSTAADPCPGHETRYVQGRDGLAIDAALAALTDGELIGHLVRRRGWYHCGPGELRKRWVA